MIVGYGFERLALHRVSLQVYSFNPRARHVYDKVGFVPEGVLRDALQWDGEWIDAPSQRTDGRCPICFLVTLRCIPP